MLAGIDPVRPATLEELIPPTLAGVLNRLDLASRKMLSGSLPGERRSKRRGRSVEFDDYRPYVAGDDLRHIDWNVYARFDRFVLKLFREEEDLALHILVDCSASMDAASAATPTKTLYAHRLAMALAYIGVVNQNRVSVATFGRGAVRQLAPVRPPAVRNISSFLLESLAETAPAPGSPTTSFNEAVRTLAMRRAGRGIVVLISDFLVPEGVTPALNALAASDAGPAGYDTLCLRIMTPAELDPRKEGDDRLIGDLRLTDSETARHTEVTISAALLKKYKAAVDEHVAAIQRACTARGMVHVLVTTDTPVEKLILESLRRQGVVR